MTLPGSNLQERRLSHADGARERAANLLEEKSLQLFRSETQNREVAESALRESEERYRRLIESSPFSILIEVDQCVVFVNSAAKLLFGAAKHEDLLGSAVTSWLVKAWPSPDVAGEELHAWEDQARRLDGSLRDVSVKRIPVIYHGKAAVQASGGVAAKCQGGGLRRSTPTGNAASRAISPRSNSEGSSR